MRRDWIMTDIEREEKRKKIEENKRRKIPNSKSASFEESNSPSTFLNLREANSKAVRQPGIYDTGVGSSDYLNSNDSLDTTLKPPIRRRRRRRRNSSLDKFQKISNKMIQDTNSIIQNSSMHGSACQMNSSTNCFKNHLKSEDDDIHHSKNIHK